MNLVIVSGQEDWQGLYIDGALVYEDHSLRLHIVLDILRDRGLPIATIERRTLNDAAEKRLNADGGMPRTLAALLAWEEM